MHCFGVSIVNFEKENAGCDAIEPCMFFVSDSRNKKSATFYCHAFVYIQGLTMKN